MNLKRLRRRLREHSARGAAGPPPIPRPTARAVEPSVVVDETLPLEPALECLAPDERERLLFFDLETTGLAGRDRIFMAGYLHFDGARLRLVQEVAADEAEERLLLARALERVRARPRLVTYNGRSFDVPALRRRLHHHGLPPPGEDLEVVDLLHPVRRRYRRELPDCRLSTVEREVLGVVRQRHDIPGVEVPLRYRDYVESGDERHLDPILYHNRLDLVTLARLYPVVVTHDDENCTGVAPDGADSGERTLYSCRDAAGGPLPPC